MALSTVRVHIAIHSEGVFRVLQNQVWGQLGRLVTLGKVLDQLPRMLNVRISCEPVFDSLFELLKLCKMVRIGFPSVCRVEKGYQEISQSSLL
jgi:hypothetical protein